MCKSHNDSVLFRNPNPSGEGLVAFNQFLHNKQALAELVHGTVHCPLVPRPKHGLLKIASISIDKKVSQPNVRSITLFHVSQLLKVTFCFQNKLLHVTHINTLHCLQTSSTDNYIVTSLIPFSVTLHNYCWTLHHIHLFHSLVHTFRCH